MRTTKIRRCHCGHPKSIHVRMYGPISAKTKLPHNCNFPGCKCKQYAPSKAA